MGSRHSGRRPQPTALKVLRGNPGQRKLNDQEPIPVGEAEKPTWLTPAAAAVWDEIAPGAIAMGVLTSVDVSAFGKLCELEKTARMASDQMRAPGFAPFLLSQDFDGAPKVSIHPAVKLERETSLALRAYYERFGLEPSARTRIKVPNRPAEPESKWAGVGIV